MTIELVVLCVTLVAMGVTLSLSGNEKSGLVAIVLGALVFAATQLRM